MHFARPCAGDDDRRVAGHGTGAPADLETVDTGQHQVEDQRVPATALQFTNAGVAVGGMRHGVALVVQMHAQQLGDVGIVFDDQHAFGGFHVGELSRDMASGVITIN